MLGTFTQGISTLVVGSFFVGLIIAVPPVQAVEGLVIDDTGDIGIGTATPGEAVDVVRDGAASRFQLSSFSGTATNAAQFIQRRARGTAAAPAAVQQNDNLGLFSFRGMRPNGQFSFSQATITAQASQTWTNTARGTQLLFGTTENGTSTVMTVMQLTDDGRVLINGMELDVPDYVFAAEYELMPLDDLKAYITEHQHLPEVANEAEVKREGLDLGTTQMTFLKKLEELTLYTIGQHEELRALRQQNSELAERLAEKEAELARRLAAIEQQLRAPTPSVP